MVDFTALSRTAQRLIANTPGRQVTLLQFDNVPADTNEPWKGSGTTRTNAVQSQQIAVFVPASGNPILGKRVAVNEAVAGTVQIMLIAPGPESAVDLSDFNAVRDSDGSEWKITFVDVLAPSDINLKVLYQIGVKR